MATQAPAPSASFWATFALTDTHWLSQAFAWSAALCVAWVYCPWLFFVPGTTFELAMVAAVATSLAGPKPSALPWYVVLRYAVVDATFVTFMAPLAIVPLHLALESTNLLPLVGGRGYPGLLVAWFVLAYYAGLGVIGHVLARPNFRHVPLAAGGMLAALIAWQTYGPGMEHMQRQQARKEGVTQYELLAGRRVETLDQLSIGNSLQGFDNRVAVIEQDTRGRILVAGDFRFYRGRDARGFVRLTPEGQLDPGFAATLSGDPMMTRPERVRIVDDGTIVSRRAGTGFFRRREDGTIERDFQPDVPLAALERQQSDSFDVARDGSILAVLPAGNNAQPGEQCIVRLLPNGARDPAFEAAATRSLFGAPEARRYPNDCGAFYVTALPSGQWIIGGNLAGKAGHSLARLNADGSLDESFRPGVDMSRVAFWHALPDGGMLTVSHMQSGSPPPSNESRLEKLLANGEVDPSFSVPAGTFERIDAFAVQPDGRVVVAGSIKGTRGAITRLTREGKIEPGFGGADGPPSLVGYVIAMRVLADGGIILGGEFFDVKQGSKRTERAHLARLQPDGALDLAFGSPPVGR